jgi:hypothetical protein
VYRTEARPSHTNPGCPSIHGLGDRQREVSCTRPHQAHTPPMYALPPTANATPLIHHREEKMKTTTRVSSTALSAQVGSSACYRTGRLARLQDAYGRFARGVYSTPAARRCLPSSHAGVHGSRRMHSTSIHCERGITSFLYLCSSHAHDAALSLVRRRSPSRHHCARSEDEDENEPRVLSASRSGLEPLLDCSSSVPRSCPRPR